MRIWDRRRSPDREGCYSQGKEKCWTEDRNVSPTAMADYHPHLSSKRTEVLGAVWLVRSHSQ
jgi:hypothetical protein